MDMTSQEAAVVYELCQRFSRGTEQNQGKLKTAQLRKQIPCFLVCLFIYLFTATFNIKQIYILPKDYNYVCDLYGWQNKHPLFTYNITGWFL
jgi:hypothetical protein